MGDGGKDFSKLNPFLYALIEGKITTEELRAFAEDGTGLPGDKLNDLDFSDAQMLGLRQEDAQKFIDAVGGILGETVPGTTLTYADLIDEHGVISAEVVKGLSNAGILDTEKGFAVYTINEVASYPEGSEFRFAEGSLGVKLPYEYHAPYSIGDVGLYDNSRQSLFVPADAGVDDVFLYYDVEEGKIFAYAKPSLTKGVQFDPESERALQDSHLLGASELAHIIGDMSIEELASQQVANGGGIFIVGMDGSQSRDEVLANLPEEIAQYARFTSNIDPLLQGAKAVEGIIGKVSVSNANEVGSPLGGGKVGGRVLGE